MEGSLVQHTLNGLKRRLVDDKLSVQNEKGLVEEMEFQFREPATDVEINKFIDSAQLQLPEDYQNFLRLHNGAILFQPWFGGQFELYGLSAIVENKVAGFHPKSWFPIGYQDGGYLLIDGEKANKGANDYLIWLESSVVENAQHFNLNFELWFDRFIIAQGTHFWNWPRDTVDNFYRG